MRPAASEVSAGGIVTRGGKVLLVKVRNLLKQKVWTFPKGHLEPGETPRQAAAREVEEETGWRCRILVPLAVVRYHFTRKGRPVKKRVRWYWMAPEEKAGSPDGSEILKVRWADPEEARRRLRYPGDFRLLDRVARLMSKP